MEKLKLSKEYIDDVLVRLAHHSSGIEGNTISLPDTARIILDHELPKRSGKSIREFYEIENHRQTFDYIIKNVDNNEALSVPIVQDIHEKLTDRLQYDKGEFKKKTNRIKGADFETASPSNVFQLVTQLLDNVIYRLGLASEGDDKLLAIIESHIQFERIHPFSDGNGRTGRMIMIYSLLQEGFPPLIIEKEHKFEYFDFLANQDAKGFVSFAKDRLKKEYDYIEKFNNKEKNTIKYSDEEADELFNHLDEDQKELYRIMTRKNERES